MASLLESLLEFCDIFPIISIVAIIICIIFSIPSIILLIAIQRSAVHKNCCLLISFWAICLIAIIANIAVLYGHMFTFTNGFLPRGIVYPNIRIYLFWVHGTLYFAGSSFEMFIVIERMLSTRQPHVYHESGRATRTIVLASLIALGFGCGNGYALYMKGMKTMGLIVHNVLDLLTLIVNILCIRYSKGRYDALYGKACLNARYQVKEANLMAKAMQPVYLVSLLLKLVGVAVGYIYTIFICCSDVRYYVLLDITYFMTHAVNCVFSSTCLIFKHASIQKAARNLFREERERHGADVVDGTPTPETTNAYFSMLGQSWQ